MKLQMTPEMLAKIKRTPDDAQLGDWVITSRTLTRPTKDATELLHKRLDEVGVVVAGDGTTITREIQRGSYEITQPLELYRAAKELLVDDARMAAAFTPSMTRLVDQVAEAMNIAKGGAGAVTATGIVDAQIKPFTKQGERRLLRYN